MYITDFSTLTHTRVIYFVRAAVQMVKDVITKRSKGLAFIQYTSQDDAMLALETMDQKVQILIVFRLSSLTSECSCFIFLSVVYRIFAAG